MYFKLLIFLLWFGGSGQASPLGPPAGVVRSKQHP